MKTIDFSINHSCRDGRFEASVLFEQGAVKVRRIELAPKEEDPREVRQIISIEPTCTELDIVIAGGRGVKRMLFEESWMKHGKIAYLNSNGG